MKKMTIDGNTAASHVAYAFSEVAAIYPITPSSPMAESADEWAAQGRENMFGQTLNIVEMQSEGGAAGAVHGSLAAGALTTTYTASQGLLLMIPNMYKIAGELLPCVFHVSARALAASSLNIFGDHSDVMACRQTGFAMLCSGSVQEVMDLSLVAHLATLTSKVPFLHFFDGFRTSHEVSKIDVIDYDEMRPLVNTDEIKEFKARSLNPEHPIQRGTAQNPDIYFQQREAVNKFYDALPDIVADKMAAVSKLTGRKYELYQYIGAADADRVIVAMGSGAEAIEETINYLTAKGEKVGMIKVRLFNPFIGDRFVKSIPASCKKLAVLDRTKEPGTIGEPMYLSACTALAENNRCLTCVGGRYGLGSKEFTPSMVNAIFEELKKDAPKNHFTIGINDDVTKTSIDYPVFINASPKGTSRCKFYGFGGDGTVGANKNSIKIIGDHTDKYAQGYFEYDSKKSGGLTVSHLRFGDSPIQSQYLIDEADFVACHTPAYVTKYNLVGSIKEGGTFLLNCKWSDEELENELPASMKRAVAKKKIKMYAIDALEVAKKAGSPKSQNMVLQAAFFKIADIIPYAEAEDYMKKAVIKSYGKKGPEVVKANNDAIDMAISELRLVKVPAAWTDATTGGVEVVPEEAAKDPYFVNFVSPCSTQEGNNIAVSGIAADGHVPTGTARYEKRGCAAFVPEWDIAKCIQCNQCAFVCPHATIRPFLLTADETAAVPATFKTKSATGFKDMSYRIQISPLDCTGCGSCANSCIAKEKALKMVPIDKSIADGEKENWDYAINLPVKSVAPNNVKNSQFSQPLFEFSGACAGCGETPYVKLITQLFGDRMIISNATGCSSIYGGSAPTCPYTKNAKGEGPAWANSLFEDNAEFGFGIYIAYKTRRAKLADNMKKAIELGACDCVAKPFAEFVADMRNVELTKKCAEEIKANIGNAIAKADGALKAVLTEISDNADCIIKKSFWIFGGDGWAYDIGYGGLDHVLAMNEDVNVLVLDTEVYSNTGGQSSKATPTGSVAKFAASGKKTKKKDLGMMAMSYGYVYVAQCSMGASQTQLLKSLQEAESYDGPSLVICYSTCINHGIKMDLGQQEQKKAVEAGYWSMYRYNPESGFTLDSKDPTASYQDFILCETRYKTLLASKPEIAKDLFARAEEEAKARIAIYKEKASENK